MLQMKPNYSPSSINIIPVVLVKASVKVNPAGILNFQGRRIANTRGKQHLNNSDVCFRFKLPGATSSVFEFLQCRRGFLRETSRSRLQIPGSAELSQRNKKQ